MAKRQSPDTSPTRDSDETKRLKPTLILCDGGCGKFYTEDSPAVAQCLECNGLLCGECNERLAEKCPTCDP